MVELFTALFSYYLFDAHRIWSDIPYFIPELVTCVLSSILVFLSVLLEVLQFSWSLQRASSLLHWFSLFLSLLFPSFCLIGVYFALFLGSWRGTYGFLLDFYFFLIHAVSLTSFSLSTAFALSHKFHVKLSFSLSSVYFF